MIDMWLKTWLYLKNLVNTKQALIIWIITKHTFLCLLVFRVLATQAFHHSETYFIISHLYCREVIDSWGQHFFLCQWVCSESILWVPNGEICMFLILQRSFAEKPQNIIQRQDSFCDSILYILNHEKLLSGNPCPASNS